MLPGNLLNILMGPLMHPTAIQFTPKGVQFLKDFSSLNELSSDGMLNAPMGLLLSIILSCRSVGCTEFNFSDKKLEHETFCKYRPICCQFSQNGCEIELPFKDIGTHHKQCQYNPKKKAS